MRTVGKVRGEENALLVCHIPDRRPERKGIPLELDRARIRHDVVRFGSSGQHGSLRGFFSSFCTGRIDVDRARTRDPFQFSLHPERNPVLKTRCNRETIRQQLSPDGVGRMANMGFIRRGSGGYEDDEETSRVSITPYGVRTPGATSYLFTENILIY